MLRNKLSKTLLATGAIIVAVTPIISAPALADQGQPPYQGAPAGSGYDNGGPPPGYDNGGPPPGYGNGGPPPGYDNGGPPPGYGNGGPPPGYDNGGPPPGYGDQGPPPPPEPGAPPGYDGRQPPPPPPGYAPPRDDAALRAADQRYAEDAQRWSRDNCVKSQGNPAAGAVIGGVLGAIIGGGLAGRHSTGAGIVAGGALGAVGGAAVASSSGGNETSPGCPPGYVVRRDAPPYAYGPQGYYYAAPPWYQPWIFVDGAWLFRPYPYHDYYWHTYRRGYYGHYGRGGYRGRPGGWRDGDHH